MLLPPLVCLCGLCKCRAAAAAKRHLRMPLVYKKIRKTAACPLHILMQQQHIPYTWYYDSSTSLKRQQHVTYFFI